jgi:hypothetical protein
MECGWTGNDECLDQTLSQFYRSLITALKLNLDLCNEKATTNRQNTFRVIHIHQICTTFNSTWNMGTFYYFTVLSLWIVFWTHGSGALPSVTVTHWEAWQCKGDKTIVSSFGHVRQFIPLENLNILLNIDQHAMQTVIGWLGFEARSNIPGGD